VLIIEPPPLANSVPRVSTSAMTTLAPFLQEQFNGCATEAAGAAGHDCNFSGKFRSHLNPRRLSRTG
jgi:hypothetical protein